ncbi:hypothetical protein SAMN06265338_102230 [Rhodoblastus acidophilus]|uniref:Phage gp6-like head-tail connector protein n=2 Tax=Rhodoblastus acidophilus TaxID=1074 RepID=A0A212R0F9_RHOAC|nr:hypothetical protein [Rhodoblastus acidophilus]PPQ40461.1 hypothetical protein CKO16_01565 [Rhodoblastus acidophilus]RAI23055.1 hypothetical protein CH337_04265 [Rhodoblastus acidophilus]SNB65492.1 hypothetical protein SAMN06265338_102230 [Rhodoblastus acidophilus]
MITVIEKASGQNLTTLATVLDELDASMDDSARLDRLIASVSSTIARFCNRTFALERVVETFDLSLRTDKLVLSRWPVTEVVSVMINGDTLAPSAWKLGVDGVVYLALPYLGVVEVDYRAGYVLPDSTDRTLPADIEQAALKLINLEWSSRGRDPLLRSEIVEGIGRTDYQVGGVAMPADVASLLAPYVLPGVA